jgi:protein MAK16
MRRDLLETDLCFFDSVPRIPPQHITISFHRADATFYIVLVAMQNDDVIWQIINHQFCSFKSKIARERTFCQNPYNVTGLCIRSACPLANSRYATIREEEGDCYLYIKTIERAHTPKNLWEKIKLPSNYTKALELVSGQLEHFPKYLVHRNKQRLTKIHQMLIRMRKLKLRAA